MFKNSKNSETKRVKKTKTNNSKQKSDFVEGTQITEPLDELAKAEASSGVEKARLLGKAALIPGLRKPQDVGKRIEQADPENKAGMQKVATINS